MGGSLLDFIPRGCFGIRVHGRRWLKVTQPHKGPTTPIGWRAISWTPDLADAEKWSTRAGAESFIDMLLCPCEIVDLAAASGLTLDPA